MSNASAAQGDDGSGTSPRYSKASRGALHTRDKLPDRWRSAGRRDDGDPQRVLAALGEVAHGDRGGARCGVDPARVPGPAAPQATAANELLSVTDASGDDAMERLVHAIDEARQA